MVEEMDSNLVALLDALERQGELNNTYIVFTSDNGGGHSKWGEIEGEKVRFNGPLQEGKRSLFEGGLRVPFVVAGPGIRPGSQCTVPVVQYDLLPTLHDLAGGGGALPGHLDGGSLRDVFIKGDAGTVKRPGPGLIFHYPCQFHPPVSVIRVGDYKLMKHLTSGETRLYNVRTDYRELKNLAKDMPEKVAAMEKARAAYVDEVDGGTMEQVFEAFYETMDEFKASHERAYETRLRELDKADPLLELRKQILKAELDAKLAKNHLEREHKKLQKTYTSWRDSVPKHLMPEAKLADEANAKLAALRKQLKK
jgi:arylsulfatase A-like enzyme